MKFIYSWLRAFVCGCPNCERGDLPEYVKLARKVRPDTEMIEALHDFFSTGMGRQDSGEVNTSVPNFLTERLGEE